MQQRDTTIELNNLLAELQQLKIQHDQVSIRIDNIIQRTIELSRTLEPDENRVKVEYGDDPPSDGHTNRTHKSKLAEGDIVILKKPEKGRPHKGKIVSFTATGFARIDLGDGKRNPRRLPSNLIKDEQ